MRRLFKLIDKFYNISFSFLNLGILGLLFSILLSDFLSFKYKETIIGTLIYIIIILFIIALLIKAFKLVFFYFKCFFNSILGLTCEYNCIFIGNKGDLETQVYYRSKNISFSPQRVFLTDSEGFREENNFTPKYSIQNRSQHLNNSKIRIVGADDKVHLSQYDDYSEKINVYQAIWSLSIDPPLNPGEEIELVRKSIDKGLEQIAFSDTGTVFIFRCRTPYKLFKINIVAPADYLFSAISFEIDNQNGKKISLKEIISKYDISGNKSITWRIPYPDISLRYKVKFKLIHL